MNIKKRVVDSNSDIYVFYFSLWIKMNACWFYGKKYIAVKCICLYIMIHFISLKDI